MNILRSTSFRLLAVAICVSGAMRTEAQNKRQPWGKGFNSTFAHGPTVFVLVGLRQDEIHLVGKFSFENNLGDARTPRSIVIDGEQAKREFWPQVKLQVANDEKGPWKTIASFKARSGHLMVRPSSSVELKVILDPFQDRIGKYKLGKVALATGDEEIFSLSERSPP